MTSSLADYASTGNQESSIQIDTFDADAEWTRFLKSRHANDLEELNREYPFRRTLFIKYTDVEAFGVVGTRMADDLLYTPSRTLDDIHDTITTHHLVKSKKKDPVELNIRIINLPIVRRISIRDIRSQHIGQLISVEGIVRKSTEVQPRITLAVYRCPSGHRTTKPQSYGVFAEPDGCQVDGCNWGIRKMELLTKFSKFTDSQKLQIQESPEGMKGGNQPQSITCILDDDITGMVNPGDRVTVNAIVRTIERRAQGEKSTTYDKYLEVISIEIAEKEFAEIQISEKDIEAIEDLARSPNLRDLQIQSIAPTIFGMEDVKETLMYILFGGLAKVMPDGSYLRGDIHCLLIGDPGIAKSQMIRYVIQLSPRGIFTSGQSSSSAGLTAAAVKDNFGGGGWTLEAGALVLADMGVCGVDEMDKMDKEDRSSLHEAMEQQTISIAKAGLCTTMKTRCALIGAANPKYGRFDEFTAIGEQINMPPSLLSRFDVIFVLTDKPEKEYDHNLSGHILKAHQIGEKILHNKHEGIEEDIDISTVSPPISKELFIKSIAYAKRAIFPVLTPEAFVILQAFYERVRGLSTGDKPVPITARSLEALVRLSEAVARSRFSKRIEKTDAERTIRIVDISLRQVAYDPNTGTYDIDGIATGTTKERRDIFRSLKEVIKAYSESGSYPDEEKVIKTMISRGFTEEKSLDAIKKLKKENEISSPRDGLLKVIA